MGLSKKYNLFNINFFCIFGINFAICLVFYMSTISSTDYVLGVLNLQTSTAGLIMGAFVIGALLSRLYFGSIIDDVNIKKVIVFSLLFYLFINLMYLKFYNVYFLILIRFLAGICYGICSCACGAAIARIIPSNKRGVGIGYYATSVVLTSALGPFLAIKLDSINQFWLSFLIACLSIVFALVLSIFLKVRRFKKHHHIKRKFSIYNYFEKSVLNLALVTFLLACPFGAIIAYMSAYTQSLNLAFAGSMFFVIYAGFSMVFRPLSGKVFDKYGANIVMIFSFLSFIVCLLLLAFALNFYMIILAGVFCALGYANATSSAQALAIKLAPKEKMGLANSTFFIALDFGIGVSPYLLGIIEPSIGFANVYAFCALLVAMALILYCLLVTKKASY
ncbi:MFS transporter [Campylobacter lari]|nr:MFS transporter [Campylobacter lari]EAK0804291.1 MFS transporter [Campylobacter lari]EGK7522049.1 MFS transporter [Campylobacter lari]EGK8057979.1 MFS transporter [Campylobacter lari]EGK8075806.1 MFS transporter [Campylobacter lari]